MYNLICGWCGAHFEARYKNDVRKFCSKKCYGENQSFMGKQRFADEADEAPRRRAIHPRGFENLVRAIVIQARDDIRDFEPGSPFREDAEEFFLSGVFDCLTGLDGEMVLRKIVDKYDRKRQKDGGQKA